ncbi:hypothetical protein BDP27DRAFT_1321951 [Rhodocollybia butyracea]|uniref:Uncharacterized protein n=1 Tax=Rhodocollybia butyracea TaxID=206335 RepID=A0A9P5PY61_9AGAR|nr:hypothetical protein BDP27DRAFT_1321951 [Rhodocollybia butyracea]
MGQASKASFDNNQPGLDYSEEMLLLMRSMHSMMQAREEREASILRSSPGPAHPASTPVTSQLTSNIQGNSSLVAHISSGNLSVESLGVTEDHTIQPSTPAEFSTLPRAESVLEESLGVDEGSHGVSAHPSPQIQVATATESTSTHQAGVHTARAPDQPNNALPVQASDLAGQGAKNGPFKAHRCCCKGGKFRYKLRSSSKCGDKSTPEGRDG